MSFWKYVLKLYLRFWPVTLMTLFGYCVVIVFDSLVPAFIAKELTDVVMVGRNFAFDWLFFVAVIYLIVTIFHYFESRYWSWKGTFMRRWIHMDLYRRVMQKKQFSEFKKYPPEYWTDAVYNIQNQETQFTLLIDIPRQSLALLTVFIINAVIFFNQSSIITLFVLVPAIAVIGYSVYVAFLVRTAKRKLDKMRIDLRKSVADSLGNIRCIRANSQLDKEIEIIDNENMEFTNAEFSINKITWLVIIVPRIINMICIIGALWFGLDSYFDGSVQLDMLVFMVVSLASTMRLAENVKHPILNYIDRIASVMHSFDIIYGNPEILQNGTRRINKIKTIDVENITFGYDDEIIMDCLSFHIGSGQHIGINGRSGAGKTTLFNLILGLYRPKSGNVLINGISLSALDITRVRRQIFMSVQNAPLMNRSLRENIKFANPHISDKYMIVAAKQAEIHDFIVSLPDGYDTVAGNVGARMSGGQINRIMLARAFASGADVLLLDEPTAAVDAKTEEKIIKTIRRDFRGRAVVIISHNKKILESMDTVVNFKKSGIVC